MEKRRARKTEYVPSPEELVRIFFENVEPKNNSGDAVLSHINGITEHLKRPLKRHDIRTTTKPLCTLEQHFPSPKEKRSLLEKQTNAVYKINCADCSWSYIGEIGRAFEPRNKEHKRNVEQFKSGSNIPEHARTHDHKINFDDCKILDKATYRHRTALESWHTATTLNSDTTRNIYQKNIGYY